MPAINKLVMAHDDIGGADEVGVDLSIFTDFGTASDLLWWWEMEFGTGRSRMGSEIDWLFQQGIERARRGYQRRIAGYSVMAGAVGRLVREGVDLSDPASLPWAGIVRATPGQDRAIGGVIAVLS